MSLKAAREVCIILTLVILLEQRRLYLGAESVRPATQTVFGLLRPSYFSSLKKERDVLIFFGLYYLPWDFFKHFKTQGHALT